MIVNDFVSQFLSCFSSFLQGQLSIGFAPKSGRLGPAGGPKALVEEIQQDAGHFVLAAG